MPFTLPPGKSVQSTFSPTDASGNPGSVASPPSWVSSDPTIVAINGVRSDGLQATLTSAGKPGTATITVTEPAPNGFTATDTVTVAENPATGGTFSYGAPF